ncbi:MAG: hypothetical protein GF330_03610 [Candidatus Eisenbacteria bacterium]|nr:hypothetical protein [Candidatus Eisenbacteria bacterium]
MKIDWFTLVAQIVNFGILVVVLKLLLYDRIIGVMDRRESDLESRLEGARRKEEEAKQQAEENRRRERELEERREELLAGAREEAEAERRRLRGEAREAVREQRARWLQALQDEQGELVETLQQAASQQSLAIARHALRELADEKLGAQAGRLLARRWSEQASEQQGSLAQAMGKADGKVVVRSATALSAETLNELADVLSELAETDLELEAETDEKLIWGLELDVGGRRVPWSARHLLEELGHRIAAELARARTQAESGGEESGGAGEPGDGGEDTQRSESQTEDRPSGRRAGTDATGGEKDDAPSEGERPAARSQQEHDEGEAKRDPSQETEESADER